MRRSKKLIFTTALMAALTLTSVGYAVIPFEDNFDGPELDPKMFKDAYNDALIGMVSSRRAAFRISSRSDRWLRNGSRLYETGGDTSPMTLACRVFALQCIAIN